MGSIFASKITFLPQWQRSWNFALLLENIILSPTDVSQEPCHSGAVSASSCSWLGGKWHKLPIVWIAHLLLASTLKAYHDIIPDNLVGGDWGIPQAGNKQSRQDPAQHANGSGWAWIGVCCHLHWEALWRFFQVAPRIVPYNKRHTQTCHPRCLTKAVCIAAQRAAATAQSSIPPKKRFLQETGFTTMGPCNIYIYIYIYTYPYIHIYI